MVVSSNEFPAAAAGRMEYPEAAAEGGGATIPGGAMRLAPRSGVTLRIPASPERTVTGKHGNAVTWGCNL